MDRWLHSGEELPLEPEVGALLQQQAAMFQENISRHQPSRQHTQCRTHTNTSTQKTAVSCKCHTAAKPTQLSHRLQVHSKSHTPGTLSSTFQSTHGESVGHHTPLLPARGITFTRQHNRTITRKISSGNKYAQGKYSILRDLSTSAP